MRDHTGLLACFPDEASAVQAARALVARGFRELDAFTPRPVPALEQLITPERSTLPARVLVAGVLGAATAIAVQWFCNAWDYPLNVGGRPPFSLPAFIPITFELMVLFAALTAFFGVLRRSGLPRLVHPVFAATGFQRASIDRFFLFVSAHDPLFQREQVEAQLNELGSVLVQALPAEHWAAP